MIQTSSGLHIGDRLIDIEKELRKLAKEYKPTLVGVESLFFNKNVKTAISVAQSRGVALLTIRKLGIPLLDFSPPQIKLSVAGIGSANKQEVQKMVKLLLGLDKIPKPDDAADALAVGICAVNYNKDLI